MKKQTDKSVLIKYHLSEISKKSNFYLKNMFSRSEIMFSSVCGSRTFGFRVPQMRYRGLTSGLIVNLKIFKCTH